MNDERHEAQKRRPYDVAAGRRFRAGEIDKRLRETGAKPPKIGNVPL